MKQVACKGLTVRCLKPKRAPLIIYEASYEHKMNPCIKRLTDSLQGAFQNTALFKFSSSCLSVHLLF